MILLLPKPSLIIVNWNSILCDNSLFTSWLSSSTLVCLFVPVYLLIRFSFFWSSVSPYYKHINRKCIKQKTLHFGLANLYSYLATNIMMMILEFNNKRQQQQQFFLLLQSTPTTNVFNHCIFLSYSFAWIILIFKLQSKSWIRCRSNF